MEARRRRGPVCPRIAAAATRDRRGLGLRTTAKALRAPLLLPSRCLLLRSTLKNMILRFYYFLSNLYVR